LTMRLSRFSARATRKASISIPTTCSTERLVGAGTELLVTMAEEETSVATTLVGVAVAEGSADPVLERVHLAVLVTSLLLTRRSYEVTVLMARDVVTRTVDLMGVTVRVFCLAEVLLVTVGVGA